MKLSDATQKSKGIDDKILELIDLKTEDDMRQVITQLQASEKILGEKLQSTDKHLQSTKQAIDTQLQSLEKSMEKRFDFLLWVVGIAFTIIAIAMTIIALK